LRFLQPLWFGYFFVLEKQSPILAVAFLHESCIIDIAQQRRHHIVPATLVDLLRFFGMATSQWLDTEMSNGSEAAQASLLVYEL